MEREEEARGLWRMLHCMQLILAHIGSKPSEEFAALTKMYLDRMAGYCPATSEGFKTEAAFLEWVGRQRSRPYVVMLDSRGRSFSSEGFAQFIAARREESVRQLVFAVGPADGWSETALSVGRITLSLGPMTLAHSVARVVLAEQLYRAFTILAGHPYHTGHSAI